MSDKLKEIFDRAHWGCHAIGNGREHNAVLDRLEAAVRELLPKVVSPGQERERDYPLSYFCDYYGSRLDWTEGGEK